jgi:hypothetical protein
VNNYWLSDLWLTGEDHAWRLDDNEPNVLVSVDFGNTRDARPVIRTTTVRPVTIFSERDIFMVFPSLPHLELNAECQASEDGKAVKDREAAP